MKPIYRDVRTGRSTGKDNLSRPGYRLGESWFEVRGYECVPDCKSCDGFEVCLRHIAKGKRGGGASSPVWPIISCSSEEEVAEMIQRVITFARTINAEDEIHDHFDKDVNGDARLAAWLRFRGFRRRNHIAWTREHT
jgi:hypothetical protein